MPALIDLIGLGVVGVVFYLFYRLLVVEKEKDLKRREAEIQRKDLEIERLRKDLNLYK
jgi:hypothetical protein